MTFLAVCGGVTGAGCGLTPSSQAAAAGDPADRGGIVKVMVAPDDDTTPLVEAIRSARRRVSLEMYLLTASDAISALIEARSRGVDVRVLLEPSPYGDLTANQPAFVTLAGAGVDVRWNHRAVGLLHAKAMVIDGKWAYVMSLNLTVAGLRGNREYAAIFSDAAEVQWAESIWNADAIGGDPGLASGGGAGRLLVSPLNARPRLSASIMAARQSIRLEVEEISDEELVARLAAARARGVAVTVVAPANNRSAATTAALQRLADAGVTVRLLPLPTLHGKAMVVDGRQIYLGSVNFTRASLDDNREVGLLWNDPAAAARVGTTIAGDADAGLLLTTPGTAVP